MFFVFQNLAAKEYKRPTKKPINPCSKICLRKENHVIEKPFAGCFIFLMSSSGQYVILLVDVSSADTSSTDITYTVNTSIDILYTDILL